MLSKSRLVVIGLFVVIAMAAVSASAQLPGKGALQNPSPELIGQLTKGLSITPAQATGGVGALFGLAKTRLKPEEFTQVSDSVPGMDGLLKAAPKTKTSSLSSMSSMLPGNLGGLSSVAGSFKSLGLKPEMALKFVPIMTKFVGSKGGAGVASLLGGALK